MPKALHSLVIAVAGILVWLAAPGLVSPAERDLDSGLVALRAGAQIQAEQHLMRYRDEERDPGVRRSVDRVLALLKRPLAAEVREYIAATLEEAVRVRPMMRAEASRPSYWSRMFPVFP